VLHEVDGLRTFAVVMDKDDDAVEQLTHFARDQDDHDRNRTESRCAGRCSYTPSPQSRG
jgi:hypothetical protein